MESYKDDDAFDFEGVDELSSDAKIELVITNQSEDFKKNVCIPYFKDIYKVSRLLSF